MLHIHRKKILLIGLLASLFSPELRAQSTMRYRRVHLEDYEDRAIRYGFLFAAPMTRFNVKYSPGYVTADSAYQLYSPNKVGFRVGFVMNAVLSEHFDVRITPAVSLYGRSVEYRYPGGIQKTELRESTWLEFPLLLKYKSKRRMNSRMYVVGGTSLGIETNVRRREVAGASRLLTKNTDLTVEYGIGFEQFFEFFKFAPELRFSHGLVNLFEPLQGSPTSVGIQKLRTHTVTLYLTFE
ncbi:type IX secretion/gliding motility protein PorT/SprT [Larkinella soli]|uniref:type IX secretion/gliding motility protein PorT/SprT n=1 Tax=Larkinella soli TaxID=1770527 RepID=UPI001E5999C7|nr:outer membrane beta-barrel protein [Larkinella soli]